MNSSSNTLNNMATFEGFNINYHGIMSSSNNEFAMPHDDQMLRSSVPAFDPTIMTHFFPSPHGCNNMSMPETEIMLNSSPSVSGAAFLGPHKLNNKLHQDQNHGVKKRKRTSEREIQKPKDVVHVRAKRGQATDSHSLAERLRREKINDKLRSLQDLVPGCYKTMGMAVMLDVIINYVRSLQNQIDFLSMKLSAASLFYDFNSSEAEAMEALQGNTGYEGGIEKVVGDGYGGISQFQNAAWPL